jgi:hypothetical protein
VGVSFLANGATFTNSGAVTGGAGATATFFTSPGAGGAGVSFLANGATFTNSGSVTSGARGAGSAGGGVVGAGVIGVGLMIVSSGAISGGLSGDGVIGADAIDFTGGANVLELRAGSRITGNVVAFSSTDTFRLGGASNATFDISWIGTQYQNFGFSTSLAAAAGV